MTDWLKRIFGTKQETTSPPLTSQETLRPQVAPITITVSVGRPSGKPAQFRSSALTQLWEQVGAISHPQHPFLDQSYSPNSLMPAADFSLWVTERLGSGDWDSIQELLSFIASEPQISGVCRTFESYNFGKFLVADPALLLELKAISILAYRIQWTGHESSRASLLAELFGNSLACYPFAVRSGAVADLLDCANKAIRRRNREIKTTEPPLEASHLITSQWPEAGVRQNSSNGVFRLAFGEGYA